MKLEHEFIQLPIKFDSVRLAEEVKRLDQSQWIAHHEGFKGNFSVPLVSVNGEDNNDFKGQMAETKTLKSCRYLRQVLGSFGEVIGRSRLMGLEAGSEVPLHSDINYHWYKRVRIHIPIVTDPNVSFFCGDKQVHMQPGEAWVFDSWKYHKVCNNSDVFRVHLVIDLSGSSKFWDFVKSGFVPWLSHSKSTSELNKLEFRDSESPLKTERYNVPLVMSPGEMEGFASDLIAELNAVDTNDPQQVSEMTSNVLNFCHDWRQLWSQFGMSEQGWPFYHALRQSAFEGVKKFDQTLKLSNGTQAPRMFLFCMIDPALNVEVKDDYLSQSQSNNKTLQTAKTQSSEATGRIQNSSKPVQPAVISRNAPCSCGSGKKFKNCHGQLA